MSQNFSIKQFFTKLADFLISLVYVVLMAVAIIYLGVLFYIAC